MRNRFLVSAVVATGVMALMLLNSWMMIVILGASSESLCSRFLKWKINSNNAFMMHILLPNLIYFYLIMFVFIILFLF